MNLTLREALHSFTRNITLPDGRVVALSHTGGLASGAGLVLPGLGMPRKDSPLSGVSTEEALRMVTQWRWDWAIEGCRHSRDEGDGDGIDDERGRLTGGAEPGDAPGDSLAAAADVRTDAAIQPDVLQCAEEAMEALAIAAGDHLENNRVMIGVTAPLPAWVPRREAESGDVAESLSAAAQAYVTVDGAASGTDQGAIPRDEEGSSSSSSWLDRIMRLCTGGDGRELHDHLREQGVSSVPWWPPVRCTGRQMLMSLRDAIKIELEESLVPLPNTGSGKRVRGAVKVIRGGDAGVGDWGDMKMDGNEASKLAAADIKLHATYERTGHAAFDGSSDVARDAYNDEDPDPDLLAVEDDEDDEDEEDDEDDRSTSSSSSSIDPDDVQNEANAKANANAGAGKDAVSADGPGAVEMGEDVVTAGDLIMELQRRGMSLSNHPLMGASDGLQADPLLRQVQLEMWHRRRAAFGLDPWAADRSADEAGLRSARRRIREAAEQYESDLRSHYARVNASRISFIQNASPRETEAVLNQLDGSSSNLRAANDDDDEGIGGWLLGLFGESGGDEEEAMHRLDDTDTPLI